MKREPRARRARLPAAAGGRWLVVAALPPGARAATCEGDKTLVTLPAIAVPADEPVGTV
ncbi:pilus assembly protein, partial [Burkholderia pseudomallei]